MTSHTAAYSRADLVVHRMWKLAVAHGLFGTALLLALGLRVLAIAGYPTALWFGDSVGYLRSALHLEPSPTRPSGYSVMLRVLEPFHSFVAVVTVQHLIGLATGVMLYALVWRHARAAKRRAWVPGALGTAVALPVLFDAYQIELEHLLLSDTLFTFLVVAAVVVLLWRPNPTWRAAAFAGALLGLASATRAIGLPLLAVVLLWLFLRRKGFRDAIVPAVAVAVAFAIPVGLYMTWYHRAHGEFAMTETEKTFLYGRTADFADCSIIKPRPELQGFCPRTSPKNVSPPYAALWTDQSPFARIGGGKVGGNEKAGEFAIAAIRAQPDDYARVVLRDTLRAFYLQRTVHPSPWTFQKYEFPAKEQSLSKRQAKVASPYARTDGRPVAEPYAGWMRTYQDWVHLPGIGLGALLLAAATGVVLRRGPRRRVLLPWMMSAALLVVPAATADFDYRYVLPAVPLGALAAGLAYLPGRRANRPVPERKAAERPPPALVEAR
ncbi:hypothetical protein [Actinomadura vinacea]|uniref:hypothetical protein n=1 Tax=Actinomadura vinacea TaxID=115336 RepID=UPI0031D3931A